MANIYGEDGEARRIGRGSEGGETEDISKLTKEREDESGKEEVIEYPGGGGVIALTQMPD
jgi:hypothetical protein